MTLPRSIWLTRLASTNSLLRFLFLFLSIFRFYPYSSCCFFQLRYPDICMSFKYDPSFPIRGLYYDKSRGCLMKLDFFGSIEPDGCYFGRRRVLDIFSFIYLQHYFGLCCHLDFVFNLFMYCVLYWSLKHCMIRIIYFTSFHKHSLYFAAKMKYVKWFLLKFIPSKFYSWAKVK